MSNDGSTGSFQSANRCRGGYRESVNGSSPQSNPSPKDPQYDTRNNAGDNSSANGRQTSDGESTETDSSSRTSSSSVDSSRSVFTTLPLRSQLGSRFLKTLSSVLGSNADSDECQCEKTVDGATLHIDATLCDGDGNLENSLACRRFVIRSLEERSVEEILVTFDGLQYRYSGCGVALLSAVGRFIELLGADENRIITDVIADPLVIGREVTTRADRVGTVGVESDLVDLVERIDREFARDHNSVAGSMRTPTDGPNPIEPQSISSGAQVGNRSTAKSRPTLTDVLHPTVGLSIGYYFVDRRIDDSASITDIRPLDSGSAIRIYSRPSSVPRYALDPVELSLSPADRSRLESAYEAIAEGIVHGDRAASRALDHVTSEDVDVTSEDVDPTLSEILRKYTSGYGVLEDLFADPAVTDVYTTAPVARNPLRVVANGESMTTNVHLTIDGVSALASRVRRTSGRSFSRANPTVDATFTLENGTGVRIAGVTDPVANGIAFAFREQADDRFTLPALVANGTMSADLAGFLSVAIERNAAALIAGTRGSGKTTLLGTLLYELTPDTRTVVIEDTPELPVDPLQSVDRDVQALRTGTGDGPEITPAAALRTALRLGDGALVVGEIRGEEARVLYEAMRVGANANAVMGTIHGDGGADVFERVVSDLGVEPSSFAVTDLVVTAQAYRTADGKQRRVARVEEVISSDDDIWFEPLFALDGERAIPTGRIDRGESHLVNRLAGPDEAYADVRHALTERSQEIRRLATNGRTSPAELAAAYAESRLG